MFKKKTNLLFVFSTEITRNIELELYKCVIWNGLLIKFYNNLFEFVMYILKSTILKFCFVRNIKLEI